MSEILSIESIQRAARAAAASGARVANPYPELHPAHDLWAQTYAASQANAFTVSGRPSIMNTPVLRRVAADSLARIKAPDALARRGGEFLIDPNPQASRDKRRALVFGGL